MSTVKKIGIWVDHSIEHLMEYTTGIIKTITVKSNLLKQDIEYSMSNSNQAMTHLLEQKLQSENYSKLYEMLENCKEVILFGSTYAKVKLYNILKRDFRFKNSRFAVIKTNNMSKKEQEAFIKERFAKSIL